MTWKLIAAAALLASCADESLTGEAEGRFVLAEIDGTAFPARATLELGEDGAISGEAPCNRYSGTLTAPYPWFETGPLATTRMACPDLAAKARFSPRSAR